ncbi:MAG: hypothetical protein HQL54_05450 [Magnetococcales bacterium]|nr:hypothetical protein [Magnetococcales bacterium]
MDFVDAGGRKTYAAVLFKLSRATIYNWLNRSNLEPTARKIVIVSSTRKSLQPM